MRLVLGVLALLLLGCSPGEPIVFSDGTVFVSSRQLDDALLDVQINSGLYSFNSWIGPPGDCEIKAVYLRAALWDAFSKQSIFLPFMELQTVFGKPTEAHKTVMVMTSESAVRIDPNDGRIWDEK